MSATILVHGVLADDPVEFEGTDGRQRVQFHLRVDEDHRKPWIVFATSHWPAASSIALLHRAGDPISVAGNVREITCDQGNSITVCVTVSHCTVLPGLRARGRL